MRASEENIWTMSIKVIVHIVSPNSVNCSIQAMSRDRTHSIRSNQDRLHIDIDARSVGRPLGISDERARAPFSDSVDMESSIMFLVPR